MSFILKQISELPKKNEASKDDLLLVDQKQADNTYISKCATLEQIGNYLTGIVEPSDSDDGSDDGDVIDVDNYSIIPLSVSEINSIADSITLPSDGILYGTTAALDNCYVQYPGNSSFQEINRDYIPYLKSTIGTTQRYLNLPKGTKFYIDNTSKILLYLKINKSVFKNNYEKIDSFQFNYNDKTLISEEVESQLKGVYYYAKLKHVKITPESGPCYFSNRLYLYVKNNSDYQVFYNIINKKISRVQYVLYKLDDGTLSGYGDYKDGEEDSTVVQIQRKGATTKGKILYPGEEDYICYLKASFATEFYDDKIYKNYIKEKQTSFQFKFLGDTLRFSLISISQLKNSQ